MKQLTSLISFGLLLGTACGGTNSDPILDVTTADLRDSPFAPTQQGPTDRAGAEARAAAALGGTVLSSELDQERGLAVYEVYVRMASGAVIEVDVAIDSGDIVQLESEIGPFTDALSPGAGFLDLQDALTAARAQVAGEIVGWELELDGGLRWKYEVKVRTAAGDQKVELDARTGAILESQNDDSGRDPWDDHGDDGIPANAPQSALDVATAIVAGTVSSVEEELEHGMNAWKIRVVTASGATVEIYLLVANESLLRVRDDEGPFDYEVTPGAGYLTLTDALTLARDGSSEEVERYRLDRDDDNGRLVYELELVNGGEDRKVEVDALSGTLRER